MKNNSLITDLLAAGSPDQYKAFIFHLQTTLIESGYTESLTESGRSEFAARLQGLYNFFDQISQQKK
jgi:hypothetical protein